VGVFSIASAWTLGGPTGHGPVPDMETWMVLELMDRGNLAAAVRHGAFVNPVSRAVRQVREVGGHGLKEAGGRAVNWFDSQQLLMCVWCVLVSQHRSSTNIRIVVAAAVKA
jgi:hypothetical protein